MFWTSCQYLGYRILTVPDPSQCGSSRCTAGVLVSSGCFMSGCLIAGVRPWILTGVPGVLWMLVLAGRVGVST